VLRAQVTHKLIPVSISLGQEKVVAHVVLGEFLVQTDEYDVPGWF
jgi:hypothetical protein